jgi:hypothetical protein
MGVARMLYGQKNRASARIGFIMVNRIG